MTLEGAQLGHYRLTRFLKGGGMGEVYLAEDLKLPREVAIKVMKTEGALYPNSQSAQEAERLFQREMRAIAMLDHPNILTLLESGEQNINHEQITYMVMPYCPAGSLSDWIKQYHGGNLLSPQEVSQLLTQAAEALQHAHDQHILHLDIKPQNFLVRRQQDPTALPNLLLADFGVAKIANTTKMTGTARGTLAYMAPEQLANQPVPASDQYALAIMAYALLTGRTPFDGAVAEAMVYQHAQVMPDPPSKVNKSLPLVLDAVLMRALAKKPDTRFGSVREFAQAFAVALKPVGSQESGAYTGATYIAPQRQRPVSPPPPSSSSSSPVVPPYPSSPSAPLSSSSPVVPPYPSAPLPPAYPSYSGYPPSQGYPPYSGYPPSQPYRPPHQQTVYPPMGQPAVWQPPQKRKLGFWWAVLFGVIAGFFAYEMLRTQAYYPGIWSSRLILPFLLVIAAGFVNSMIVGRTATGTFTGAIAGVTYIGRAIYDIATYHHSSNPVSIDISFLLGILPTVMLLGFIGGLLGTTGVRFLMSSIKRTPTASPPQ